MHVHGKDGWSNDVQREGERCSPACWVPSVSARAAQASKPRSAEACSLWRKSCTKLGLPVFHKEWQ
eukprot:4565535-Amphidinium_carterae.2